MNLKKFTLMDKVFWPLFIFRNNTNTKHEYGKKDVDRIAMLIIIGVIIEHFSYAVTFKLVQYWVAF